MELAFLISAVILGTASVMEVDAYDNQNNQKVSNVSHFEFDTKMKMFHEAVRGTEQETIHTVTLPTNVENQGTGNELITFSSYTIPRAVGHILRMFVSNTQSVTVYEIYYNGYERMVETVSMVTGPRWVGVFFDALPAEELRVRIACDIGCQIQDVKLNSFSRILSGERKIHGESHICSPDAQDDDPKVYCCLKHREINIRSVFSDQKLEGPVWNNFGYCIGHCPPNYNYATEHARLRHVVERSRDQKLSNDPCLPSQFADLTVLISNGEDLLLRKWDHFYALTCGCF